MRGPADTIVCVDCGGTAHLVSAAREDGSWFAGDIVTYRCSDCRDRWDLELSTDDLDDPDAD
jgi:hypothetical protein